MKRFPSSLAAASAALLMLLPGAALAQAQPQALGVQPEQVRQWIASVGGETTGVDTSGEQPYFVVNDAGTTWSVSFRSCESGVCSDMQLTALLTAPNLTLDKVNNWNRDRRFLKAFFVPASDSTQPTAVLQYDHLMGRDGVEQLADPVKVWIDNLALAIATLGAAD